MPTTGTVPTSFFSRAGDVFTPLRPATSNWSPDMIHGASVCGLLALALESAGSGENFVPVRLTVDMFRPARTAPLTTSTTTVREGNRIRVVDAEAIQDGETVARASAVFLHRSAPPPGDVWTRDDQPVPPPADLAPPTDHPTAPWFGSDGHPEGWSNSLADHQGASRKRMWTHQLGVIEGEAASPFTRAAMIGDATSLLTNWGSCGVGYINADLTLTLCRLPEGPELGLEADNHVSADGISVGTATMYDRRGSLGTCVVTALSNVQRQIDFTDEAHTPAAMR